MTHIDVGIDQVGVYLPRYALQLSDLAAARGVPVEKIHVGLGALAMAVAPPWEDSVTLAANAAAEIFRRGEVRANEIGLLIVGTETAVDHAKPIGIFVHDILQLPASCRTFEIKHACYGGTAGVMTAAEWVRSGAARGRKALVIATDIARYELGSSAEFTQGAGAAALVVSEAPRLLQLGTTSGVYAKNVYDFWRPLGRAEALVDGKFSVDCYLDALRGALRDWRSADSGPSDGSLLDRFTAFLYHAPFPKMVQKAHRRLVDDEGAAGDPDERFARSWTAQVDPGLGLARHVGNTYTASLYLCLAWLMESEGARLEDRQLALFSYGSGCCAEFFTARAVHGSAARAAEIGARAQLEARQELTVSEYEEFARASGGERPPEGGAGFCHFAGIDSHQRRYLRTGMA